MDILGPKTIEAQTGPLTNGDINPRWKRNTRLRRMIEAQTGKLTDVEYGNAMIDTANDIRTNRIAFGVKTTELKLIEIAVDIVKVYRRCEERNTHKLNLASA